MRLAALSETERDMIRLVQEPGFRRWLEQIHATGGCAHPVYLSGHTTTRDTATGAVLRHYDTAGEPGGRLAVRCRNRRESRCAPCSRTHAADTFHLVRSGLLGGKGIPPEVAGHPRLFVTLTAPSFGPVHRVTADGRRCHPRRSGGQCEHGRPVGCGLVHADTDPIVGQPLCPDCYDYPAHVLWHAHAGRLWNRFTHTVQRHLATAVGITQTRLGDHLRISFAKVAEYQQRAAIHVHAVIRLDGPDGPEQDPPHWATSTLLGDAVRSAAGAVAVHPPYTSALGEYVMRWGAQLDVHSIRAFEGSDAVTDEAVAAYVAKYTTKSVSDTGGTDHRVHSLDAIGLLPVSRHLRVLMATCWRLDGLVELQHLRLRAWAHTLGYRGHVLTKSRAYSTTYQELRATRAKHQRHAAGDVLPAEQDEDATVTDSAWRYVGSGHTPAEAEIAAGIAEDLATLRAVLREERLAHRGTGQ